MGDDDDGRMGDGDLPPGLENDAGVIWGTTINVATCYNTFRDFLKYYSIGDDFEYYYWRQLEVLHRTDSTVLNLNCSHLAGYVAVPLLCRH